MLLSSLKKLLHPTKRETSPREEKLSEEICVQNTEEMHEECEMENEETAAVEADETVIVPPDTKAHLTSSVPRALGSHDGVMTRAEIREARQLFTKLSDTEIQHLYKKVTQ